MKKAVITCMCNKAGGVCKVCAQGAKIKPDNIFIAPNWTWDNKEFKMIKEDKPH